MAEQQKAKNNVEYKWQDTRLSENPVLSNRLQWPECGPKSKREW
jgi:hypothetical protein